MKIYCKNSECQHNKKLNEPINFQFRKHHHNSFDNPCSGECSIKPNFCGHDYTPGFIRYEGADCVQQSTEPTFCNRIDCLHNSKGDCSRDEILVEKINNLWSCRCYSQMKVRGHMDWSRYPIGGSLGDAEADKIYYDNKKTKSYQTGMKNSS